MQFIVQLHSVLLQLCKKFGLQRADLYSPFKPIGELMKYVNKQNTKDQVERFGMIVRDDDFYKNAEATL